MRIFIVILSNIILWIGIFISSELFASREIYLSAQIIILIIGLIFLVYNHRSILLKVPDNPEISSFRLYQWFMTFICCFCFFLLFAVTEGVYHLLYIEFPQVLLLSIYFGCFFYEIVIGIRAIEK
jgi:hypothetical protein